MLAGRRAAMWERRKGNLEGIDNNDPGFLFWIAFATGKASTKYLF